MKKEIYKIWLSQIYRSVFYCAVAFGFLLIPLAQHAAAQDKNKKTAPNLAGEWKLNEGLSDDARTKMQEMIKSRSGGMRPGGGMGGPPVGGDGIPGGEMPNREQMEARRERMERSLDAPKNLQITQSDTEIMISETGGNDRSRTFYTDGRKNESKDTGKAKFKKSQFIVETSSDRGPKIVETYELSDDGKQLIVNLKMESNIGGGMELRRVYDAAN